MTEPDYFTLDELRAMPDLSSDTKYPPERCLLAAAYIVGVIEREVGTSFIERTETDEAHDGGVGPIMLDYPHVRQVVSATENGTTVTEPLASVGGVLYRGSTAGSPWLPGLGNILVTYKRGYSATPPADIKEMALKGTRAHLLSTAATSSMADRQTTLVNETGTSTFVVAGEKRPTGYPDVDAAILGWKDRLDVHGFA